MVLVGDDFAVVASHGRQPQNSANARLYCRRAGPDHQQRPESLASPTYRCPDVRDWIDLRRRLRGSLISGRKYVPGKLLKCNFADAFLIAFELPLYFWKCFFHLNQQCCHFRGHS